MIVNPQEFRRAGLHFIKHGTYCKAPFKTKDWYQFWNEEKRRCLEGYSVGGFYIPGKYYFYLNYFPIMRKPSEADKEANKVASIQKKIMSLPDFWKIQLDWHIEKEKAWNRPFGEGNHILCFKTRGCGWSYMDASEGVYNYNFIPYSKSFYLAMLEKYLLGEDGILWKCWDGLDHLNKNTDGFWYKNRHEKDSDWHKKASYLPKGSNTPKGFKSQITGMIVDHPRKVRGARGIKITLEELGSMRNPIGIVEALRPLVEEGNDILGQISGFGCVCAGTKVWTNNGEFVNIEDLKQEQGIIGYSQEEGITKQQDIIYQKEIGIKDCYRIKTNFGKVLECSDDHPILWSYNGMATHRRKELPKVNGKRKRESHWFKQVEFKAAAKIQIGEQVAVPDIIPHFGNNEIWEPYLVGLLVGDGSYGFDKTPVLSNAETEINQFVESNFETTTEKSHITKDNRVYKETRIRNICPKLRELGIYGQTKNRKRLPQIIYSCKKEIIQDFISGLYDADGGFIVCEKSYNITLASCSRDMLVEVMHLLHKFGIHGVIAKIKKSEKNPKDKNDHFRLTISDKRSVIRFHQNFKLRTIRKQDKLDQIVNRVLLRNDRMTTKGQPNLRFERVVSIEYIGKKEIYNLTATDTHTYIANGIITHNTGGESSEFLEEAERMFENPLVYNFAGFDNDYDDDGMNDTIGYFVPADLATPGFFDENGNPKRAEAREFWEKQYAKKEKDPKAKDLLMAERPLKPSHVFRRATTSVFDKELAINQRKRILRDRDLQTFVKRGDILPGEKGLRFIPTNDKEVAYPHKPTDNLNGCISIVYPPDPGAEKGRYILVHDPYYKDESEDMTSIGSSYVIDLLQQRICAWYNGRPKRKAIYNRKMFALAQFYNATVQSEIAGGGQDVINHARTNKLLHMIEYEPEMWHARELASSQRNKSYLMNMGGDRKATGIIYFADWLITERGIREDGSPVLNIESVYDIELLNEIIKYKDGKNADRISAMIIGMYMIKEKAAIIAKRKEQKNSNKNSIFNRPLYVDGPSNSFNLKIA